MSLYTHHIRRNKKRSRGSIYFVVFVSNSGHKTYVFGSLKFERTDNNIMCKYVGRNRLNYYVIQIEVLDTLRCFGCTY